MIATLLPDRGFRCTLLLQILSFIGAVSLAKVDAALILLGGVFISAYIFGLFEREICADAEEHLGRTIAMACVASAIAYVINANAYTVLWLLVLPPVACAIGRVIFTSATFKRRVLWIEDAEQLVLPTLLLQQQDCYSPVIMHANALQKQAPQASLLELCQKNDISEIVVATPMTEQLGQQLLVCRMAGKRIFRKNAFVMRERYCVELDNLYSTSLIFCEDRVVSPLTRYGKRFFDMAFAIIIGLLLSPLLLLGMLLVKLGNDGGAMFYSQTRVGLNGKHFTIYKLRTMRPDAEKFGAVWAQKNDPRITRFGKFLRQSRLDEIPQLWCIFCGDMSLVGPRPERPEFTTQLAEQIPHYHDRHSVRPGLTGWAQLYMHYTNTTEDTYYKLSHDLYYIKHMSLWLDMTILLKTGRVLLFTKNAC